ncbi:tail fiber domain-containing protein [Segatella copri]|uniref:Uncharacterized protein n=2 Tax=Pseudomonadati TaxID=3379134 RepID=A0AA92V1U4_9BACT|nr:tail fiber domain-containing protein [Segatella copri]RHA86970.1 hypothetical protein DW916_07225 [Segatella copri]
MRTYKDIEVKFYDTKGDVHVRCSVPVTEDALVHFELMQSHYCKLSFKLGSAIYFKMGDFIVTDYGRFELVDNVKPKDDGTLGYSYELEFDAYYRKWKNKRLKYMPNSGSPEGTFTLTSNIITHANIIKDNLDFLAKASKSYLYDPNYTGKGSDYTFVVDASVDSTKSKVITYSNSSILDAIANIAQTFECEWWVEGNLVHFGTCENTNEVVDFKDGENIVSMSSSQSQASYANRVYAFGAARNLPSGYKQNSSADVTKNGVVEKRLMLPTLEECSAENKKLLEDNGFELKNGCLQVKGLTEDEYVEGVTTNDDIYPRNLIKTSNVTYYEKDVEDESTPEEGDYIKRTFYRVKGLTIVDADGNKTGDMAFRSSYILSGKTLHIIFQSGSLNGMDFECQFNPDGESEILRDSNGSPILKDGKEQINPAAQVFEIVANEDYGRFLPDTVLHPKDGDTFVLYNWDSTKLGNTLVTSSANELLTDAIKNLKKSMIDPTTYTCTAASDYSYNDGKGQFHFEGDRVNLFNKGYDMSFRASRIIGYELHLDVPFDSVKYTVGEKPAYSRLNAMSSQIEELVFNGQSYLNKGGSGNSIYIIKSYDTTVQPTDFNVFSAKRVENSYLHKDKTDAANFLIKFLRGLQVGDYSALSGGDWSLDELFRSHLTTDYLNVRMKAIFETLEILHTDTLGGELFITTVGSNRILKVEEVNVTYDGVSQNAYRCYFLGEQDGSKVENKWKVGDQARSKSFNLTQGKFHNVGNHYYWRLVIGVSTETVEIEGKNYHYVDLSDIDKDTSSDIPMVDDVLNQVGSRTDIARQSCLVFSAVDTYSPSVTLYHGVNGYTFNNKEYVDYGVNHSTGKAFFHVYGDMYFGDRPTSANNYEGESYVKFDSETKKVTIKGDLDIKSTYDGKTLDKYITEKSLDKNAVETIINKSQTIIDLQNQIDGAIETWFYDGVPTLKNAPAISWKTDNDKKTHLGDLYYDNKTGKAYRFAKDGSTYEWIIITDTELTKALKDSSQALKDAAAADKKANGAQATANTKRRIFGSQPVPPYDVNDMWVNATYPNDGSTYKNEILKCSTSKAEGEEFDIADWKLASKYTDDTKAEEAKKAAEKAQAEIKNTQTNLIALGTTVTENKKTFDSYVKDGYLEPSEIAAMAQDSKRLEDAFAAAEKSYNEVKGAEVLKSTKELTDLNTAFTTLSTAKTELVTYLSDISTNYNKADTNGKAAIVSAVGTKFTNFQSAYSAFYDKLGLANAYITSKIYGDLKQNITDLAGYKYLKDALGQTTDIDGGLVMTTLLALRDGDGNVQSGINGAIDPNRGKKSIATWWGGQMVDKDYNSGNLTPATSLIRFDGSGYLANGAIWWDVSGKVHADPTSFIISEKNLGAYLTFFEPTWKEGSAGTSVADLVSLKPNAPFSKLGVSGDATFEGAISFHGIKLTYDSKNKAIKIDGNLYTTGGITAYGAGASTTGGGGLIASVISYARILEGSYTDADLTSIPNAYAIKALSSRIDNIASELGGLSLSWNNITGKPSTFTPSAHTHKWTEITDRITKVSQLTNDKGYLTAHQSLASYYTKAEIDAKGYTTNKGTVTSVALTLPTGLTCATKVITTSGTFAISLASGYSIPTTAKQTAWDGAVSAKHTHSNKSVLDGITSTKVTCWDSAYDWYALITTDEETADGVINKWNEVVSFLANIAQTDTLSGIVDGINKSISDEVTRAKKAEGVNASGISTNKTSITTLQGYFTSGSAKKALQLTNTRKLWGNSFNGTADINGSIIVPDGKYISIGNIKMEYDATNKALKITNTTTNEVANLYTSGGVSAYGVGTSSSSGGGLNGSVKSYSNALKLTSESLSEIASAYSIKALDSRISSLEGGSAMDVSVSGSGNAVTAISKSGTTIIVTKGTTFLTSHQSLASYLTKTDAASLYQPKGNYLTAHQSLDGYVNAIAVSGSGNAVTAVTKSGKTITFTKGSTFSLNGHTHTFASLTSKPTSLSGYGITDGVNAVSVTGSGNAVTAASVSGHTLTLTKGSTFSLSNHNHYVGTTQVQGSSAEQALTGITKIDNILKLSKASVTVNTSYKAEQNRLVIYGNTYGNDANYIKSAGKLSYGDGGPQLVFSTSENPDASGVQSAALVYTDHDTIGTGVSLSFVTNQGDAYFIAPHIKALTAFQGNLAWRYITNKPTTLSGFGITDGLRSVTQPSGSNVFVTGISTSGTAITYTKSYTKKSLSAVGTSGWTNASIDGNIIPDMSFIAYWNGAYSGTSSNLAYCNRGAFGSFAIKNSLAFSELTSKPTTISGYGITDAYTKSQVDAIAAKYLPLTGGTLTGQLKIVASALNGAYNGLRIGDDCYIGDCNIGNTIGLMGVGNNNAGMVKFGKGGMQFGYNGSNHIASTTAQWTNLNADLLDGWHKDNIVWSGAVNSNTASLSHYWAKLFDITVTSNQYDDRSFTFLFSNGFNDTYSVVVLRIRQNGAKDSGAYNFNISLRELVGNMSSRLRVYYNNATGNVQLWGNCQRQYGSLSYTIIKKTGRTSADFTSQGTLVTNTSFSAAQSLPATTGDSPYTLLDGATRIGIVKQADQLVTARSLWGQSFNGTANVSGALSGVTTISASNTISTTLQNGALKIGNKLTPISAIDAQVIFNTGAAIRFGETAWDWNQWAGLKYTHSNKTIYLGIADGSAFTAISPQNDGTLKFPGITTIIPDAAARIGGSGGALYLGNANNSSCVYVQDMCSQVNSSYWSIRQTGSAIFKTLTVNDIISCDSISVSKNAVINGNLSVNGLINNKGILPTDYDVNKKGAGCYVSADALCSGITAITDSIPVDNLSIAYTNDNGRNWTNYNISNDTKFKAYANVAGIDSLYLGSNVITGNTDAEKLAQIKKNELMFSFEIPNSCYSQVYFACVDIGQGVGVTCTVEYLNSKGVIVNTYIKYMTGWNQFNYINLSRGNEGFPVGNDDRRYIRFKFKHDQNTTALRNASINKIRIFSFTKYSFPTDRFMGHTGHIYNFDYNLNTYFPNSILAKGGVTAYQSSDIRLKQDLRKLDYLGIIKAMGGTYGFAWKKDNTRSIGWIAQHVLCNPHLKDIVETDEKGYYKINYWSPKLIATAFGAIEQVGDEVSRLKARVVFLESEVQRLSGDKEDCNKKRLDNKNINLLN